jgi:hypothetical protein
VIERTQAVDTAQDRNHRDILVTEALMFGRDDLVCDVRVSYGA